jgi:hypothetical protein
MINCPLCSEELKEQNLYKYFQISLGDFINGAFKGDKILYFHPKCLRNSEHSKSPLLTPVLE